MFLGSKRRGESSEDAHRPSSNLPQGLTAYACIRGRAIRCTLAIRHSGSLPSEQYFLCLGFSVFTCVFGLLAFSVVFPWLFRADFNCADHHGHMMNAAALATCNSADIAFVYFHRPLPTDFIAIWADHAATEFMQKGERCLAARQAELPLKLRGRNARRLGRHQVCAPKPR